MLPFNSAADFRLVRRHFRDCYWRWWRRRAYGIEEIRQGILALVATNNAKASGVYGHAVLDFANCGLSL
jgi:hypothetical protein